jgi:tellurite resistance protein TerB
MKRFVKGVDRGQSTLFWEATIAACALVAAREGKVNFATRLRIDHILDSLPDLKDFGRNEFLEQFNWFVEEFRTSPHEARTRALEVARKGASNADAAELLARIALAVVDTAAAVGQGDLEPIEALCGELNVDAKAMFDAVWIKQDGDTRAEPAAAVAKMPPDNNETEAPMPTKSMIEKLFTPPAASQHSRIDYLSQQLLVAGTKAVIALCGRTKTGGLEALRIYENEQFAAADCELSEKIANEKFWLSPVALFPSDSGSGDSAGDDEPTPIHVLCLSRPDGSIEALRAFENADNASTDLEFFQNISNDKMWISVVQYKTVTY